MVDDKSLHRIIIFFKKYLYPNVDKDKLAEAIKTHIMYGTFLVEYDSLGIVYVCRWNVNGYTAEIIDFAIREDCQNKISFNPIILRGLERFPYIKYLKWNRMEKYPQKKPVIYRIDRILKKQEV